MGGAITAWTVLEQIVEQVFELTLSTAVYAETGGLILTVGSELIGTWWMYGEKVASILRNQ